jgi:pimeloyl-ACP methyl ester carboxylesterase
VTIVGHSLGGGTAMQFVHQHRQHCDRIVLISSGGFGGDVGAVLAGNAVRALMGSTDRFESRPALSNRTSRQAFLRTLRSVVDFRGQAVTALNRSGLAKSLPTFIISGDQDRIIPVDHARAAHRTRRSSPRVSRRAGMASPLEAASGRGRCDRPEDSRR